MMWKKSVFNLEKVEDLRYKELVNKLMIATNTFTQEGEIFVPGDDWYYAQAKDAYMNNLSKGNIFALIDHITTAVDICFGGTGSSDILKQMGFKLQIAKYFTVLQVSKIV